MVLAIPKISTHAIYFLNWKLAFLNLQGKGDAYSYMGESKNF